MDNLCVYKSNSSVPYGIKSNEELLKLFAEDILVFKRMGCDNNISLSLHISMVCGFAEHLPYSMDIEQDEYVPGDFLNIEPLDVDENEWFKYDDRRTIFNAMKNGGDTFKSGILLQVCYLFQQMLLGKIPVNYSLNEEDYEKLGINKFTSNKDYNRKFFDILKKLPYFYERIMNTSNNEERRKELEIMYSVICDGIKMRVGGFRQTNAEGKMISEHRATISWDAYKDIELLVHWENITYFDGLEFAATKLIKEEQLKYYKKLSR